MSASLRKRPKCCAAANRRDVPKGDIPAHTLRLRERELAPGSAGLDRGAQQGKWRPSGGKKRLVWHMALAVPREARFNSAEEEHLEPTLVLRLDTTARLEVKKVLRAMIDRLGNIDLAGCTRGFHAGCDVHSVSPHVVNEFSATHYASNDRAGVQTDT